MSPAAPSHVVEEQTSNEQGGRIFGQPSASDAHAQATKDQPLSRTKRWFFHFEIGIKKTVRVAPERNREQRAAQPAERSGGAVPQVRMITAAGAPPPVAGLMQANPADEGANDGTGTEVSCTTYSVYTQSDTGNTVSPPYTVGGKEN